MRIVITGGGTGGHLFPGIALARGLQRYNRACEVLFITTARKLDLKVLAGRNINHQSLEFSGIKGKGIAGGLRTLIRLPEALVRAHRMLRTFGPHLVFGVGGYVTVPVLLAAKWSRIPVCIHEQNSVPGLANRILARIADKVFLSLPCPGFGGKRAVLTGNPVRQSILDAARRKPGHAGEGCILVLGGSQGAHALNRLMLEAMDILVHEMSSMPRLIHQTGRMDYDLVRTGYERLGIRAEVAPFFQDMASVYKQADLAVARAGATTLAELSIMGIPAILVPYPYAADNHQEKNASYYVRKGGAHLMRERELNANRLAVSIRRLLQDRAELHSMADRMWEAARPDAVELLVKECMSVLNMV